MVDESECTSYINNNKNLPIARKSRFDKALTKFQMLIIFFFIYAIIGWIFRNNLLCI